MSKVIVVTCLLLGGLLASRIVSGGCGSCLDPQNVPNTHVEKTYAESQEHVENPHRGFVVQKITHSAHHTPLTKQLLDRLRQNSGNTMIWRTVVLDTFVTSPISDDFLGKIRHDLDVIESASFTVVLRFCYIFEMRQAHPWGDASKDIVLQHIQQLKPLFQEYERVITSIEAGFIGAWGEWHHTEHFGNPSHHTPGHDPATGLMPEALRDRKEVLLELLHAAPKSIQVQLRYPAQKMSMMGHGTASIEGVQQGNDADRTGHHNDCFLSSDNDVGTYRNKAVEYPFLEHDTHYTIMGGETCRLTTNHRHECPTALKELALFHWTFLNQGFQGDIYTVWKQQGCYEEVHKRLGYRLVLTKAILPTMVSSGDDLCVHLELTNKGYAAPVKKIQVFIVLKSATGYYFAGEVSGVEVRDWQPGYTVPVDSTLTMTNVPKGDYQVLLLLRDPLMGHNANYNVLLANTGVPLYTQGINQLNHTITVSGQSSSSSNCTAMSSWTPPPASHYSRVFTGTF